MGKLKFSPAPLKNFVINHCVLQIGFALTNNILQRSETLYLHFCNIVYEWVKYPQNILQECYQSHSLGNNTCNGKLIHMKRVFQHNNQIYISLDVRYSSLHKNAKIVFDTFSEVGNENKFILLIVACVVRKSLNRDISRNRICQIQFWWSVQTDKKWNWVFS